jgi:hypothetical protein
VGHSLWLLRVLATTGYLQFNGVDATNTNIISGTTTIAVVVNAWHHVAVVRQSGATKIYINGVSSGTPTDTGAALINGAVPLHIGAAFETGVNSFNGYIDDLRITKGIARYTANFTPPSSAFVDSALSTGTLNALIYDNLIPV